MDRTDKVLTAVNWTSDPVLYRDLEYEKDPEKRFNLIQSVIILLVQNCSSVGVATIVNKADARAAELLEVLWLIVDDWVRRDLGDNARDVRSVIRSRRATLAMMLYLLLREPTHHLILRGDHGNFSVTMKKLLTEVTSAWVETSDEEEASLLFSFLIGSAQGDSQSREPKLVAEVIRERDSRCSLERIHQAFELLNASERASSTSSSTRQLVEALIVGLAKRSINATSGVHFADLLLQNDSSLPIALWEPIVASIRQAAAYNTAAKDLVELLVNKFGPKYGTTEQCKLVAITPTKGGVMVTLHRDLGTQDITRQDDFRKSFEEVVDFVKIWFETHKGFEITLVCRAVFNGEPSVLTEKICDDPA
jgi:hypothetical protein